MLEAFMLQVFAGGFAHARDEVDKAKAYFKKKYAEAEVEASAVEPVVPEDALNWYLTYSIYLAGILDEAILKKAEGIIAQSIQEGLHWKDIVKALQASPEFKGFAETRLATIAKTEGTKAYNKGRLEQFRSTDGYVEAVQYSAILDKRTTPLCRSLHGKIMDINNKLVDVYLPPNHFNCRSIIVPVTRYDNWKESDFSNVERPKDGFDNPEWKPSVKS
jgi:SPP1 gp7 family putative phage head morphogenesis protein